MTDHLVQVATAYSVGEAIVVQSMLRSYGIDAHTFDLGVANVDPGLMFATGGIRLFVHADDAAEAYDLIWVGKPEALPPRPYHENKWLNAFWAIVLGLLGAPPPARIPLQKPDWRPHLCPTGRKYVTFEFPFIGRRLFQIVGS